MRAKIITVKELQEKLNKNERVFILDVRPTDQSYDGGVLADLEAEGNHCAIA